MHRTPLQYTLVGITAALTALSFVRPHWPREQTLQHIPTAVALIVLTIAVGRRWLTTRSTVCLCLFLWAHILGARYIYSFVPYDVWWESLFRGTLTEQFEFRRNHYDRFVHLFFGFLLTYVIYDLLRSHSQLTVLHRLVIAFLGVVSIGALYEVFEWLLTLGLAPDQAESYNGQQGDMWDAQKDMALQTAASACVCIALLLHRKFRSLET